MPLIIAVGEVGPMQRNHNNNMV